MGYSLSAAERETIISFSDADEQATVYTCSPVWLRKLDKLCTEAPESFREIVKRRERLDGAVIAKTYTIPKGTLRIRPKRELTEAQKEVLEAARKKSPFSKSEA